MPPPKKKRVPKVIQDHFRNYMKPRRETLEQGERRLMAARRAIAKAMGTHVPRGPRRQTALGYHGPTVKQAVTAHYALDGRKRRKRRKRRTVP
jgi:hypothetical protein